MDIFHVSDVIGKKGGWSFTRRFSGPMLENKARRLAASTQPLFGKKCTSQTATVARRSLCFFWTASHINFERFDETVSTVFFAKVVAEPLREPNEVNRCEAHVVPRQDSLCLYVAKAQSPATCKTDCGTRSRVP